MRFILALVAFLLGGTLIAIGIAEQTVLKPADHITTQAEVPAGVNYVVLPASMLRANPGSQLVKVQSAGDTRMSYGSTTDVNGWLAGSKWARASLNAEGQLRFTVAAASAAAKDAVDPAGSDLWLTERTGGSSMNWKMDIPEKTSVLVSADGGKSAVQSVSVRWPVRAETPLATTMVGGGVVLGAVGLLLLLWALLHARSISHGGAGGTHLPRRARKVIATVSTAAVAVTGALFGSGSADAATFPQAVVTEQQAYKILDRVTSTIADADKKRDTDLLETRMGGPALQLREANYRILAKDKNGTQLQAIPQDAAVQLLLPSSSTAWPRTLFAVVGNADGKTLPVAISLVQSSARENYKVWYATTLQAGAKLPNLPNTVSGTGTLSPDTKTLQQAPADISTNYGMLLRDSSAKVASLFATDNDYLLASVGEPAKAQAARALGKTAKISFSDLAPEPSSTVVLAAADGSALVSTVLKERWLVTPAKKGVTIKPSGSTKLFSKTSSTKKGIQAVYEYELLFNVPTKGKGQATLLGYSQGLVDASEVK